MTIKAFIRANAIRFRADMTDANPHMDGESGRNMYHYRCRFKQRDGRRFACYFSMGYGLDREPTAADVLDCLASDAASVEQSRSFEDWASDMGWDADSRRAHRTYRIIERQSARLRDFLGADAYRTLLYDADQI